MTFLLQVGTRKPISSLLARQVSPCENYVGKVYMPGIEQQNSTEK